jgi:hypothetical protein
MQVQLSKSNIGDALDIISNNGLEATSANRSSRSYDGGYVRSCSQAAWSNKPPCVLPRHPLVRFMSGGEPKAELAMTVDFHLDRCSSPLFKASPVCRLFRRYIRVTRYSLHRRYYRIRAPLCPVQLLKQNPPNQFPHTALPFHHHICLFRQMHACSALSNSLALCQCTPAHTLAKWRSHAFSSPRMKRRLPPSL